MSVDSRFNHGVGLNLNININRNSVERLRYVGIVMYLYRSTYLYDPIIRGDKNYTYEGRRVVEASINRCVSVGAELLEFG